jgi:cell division FtsZ-interacting protein ZapD
MLLSTVQIIVRRLVEKEHQLHQVVQVVRVEEELDLKTELLEEMVEQMALLGVTELCMAVRVKEILQELLVNLLIHYMQVAEVEAEIINVKIHIEG